MQYTPTAAIDTAVTSVDVDAGVAAESKPPATPSIATLPMTPESAADCHSSQRRCSLLHPSPLHLSSAPPPLPSPHS